MMSKTCSAWHGITTDESLVCKCVIRVCCVGILTV